MATNEQRTLEIKAKLYDEMTRPLSGMEKAVARFQRAGGNAFKSVVSSALSLKTALVGLVAAYAGLQGVQAVRGIADQADAMNKLAQSTGDTVANLSELAAVFQLNNVDAGQFEAILRALSKAQADAASDGGKLADAFQQMGIGVNELGGLSPSQLFERMAAGLEKFNSPAERAVVLAKVLPKQFLAALPTLGRGLEDFQVAVRDVRALGVTITDQEAAVADRFGDSFTKLQFALESAGRGILTAFGPSAITLLENFSKAVATNKEAIVQFAKLIGEGIAQAIDLATKAMIGFVRFVESIPGVSLIDKDKTLKEIDEVQLKLEAIKQARNPTPKEIVMPLQLGGTTSTGRVMTIDPARRNEARRMAEAFGASPASEALDKQQAELEAKLKQLIGTANRGLADELDAMRQNIADKVGAAVQQVQTELNAAASTNTQSAPLQIVDPAELDKQKAQVTSVFQEITDDRRKMAEAFRSASQDETKATKDASKADQERMQIQQELAGMIEGSAGKQYALDLQKLQILSDLEDAMRRQIITAGEFAAAVDVVTQAFDRLEAEAVGGFGVGLKNSLANLKTQMVDFGTTAGAAVGNLVNQGVDGLSDALANVITGTMSAKEAMRAFAKQFLIDIARMISKMIVLGTIKTIFRLEDGGVVAEEANGGIQAFASGGVNRNGGVARRPTVLFGEGRTAEAFVPLPDNRSIPVTMTGGGGGGTVNVNITAMDSKDVTRTLIEHQSVLRNLWQQTAESRNATRQIIKRAAS